MPFSRPQAFSFYLLSLPLTLLCIPGQFAGRYWVRWNLSFSCWVTSWHSHTRHNLSCTNHKIIDFYGTFPVPV